MCYVLTFKSYGLETHILMKTIVRCDMRIGLCNYFHFTMVVDISFVTQIVVTNKCFEGFCKIVFLS